MDFKIVTDRLTLRQPELTDASAFFQLMSDEKLTTFLTWEAHKDVEATKTLIHSLIEAQKNDKGYHWCVCLNDKIIGLVSLIDIRRQIRTWTINRAEL